MNVLDEESMKNSHKGGRIEAGLLQQSTGEHAKLLELGVRRNSPTGVFIEGRPSGTCWCVK